MTPATPPRPLSTRLLGLAVLAVGLVAWAGCDMPDVPKQVVVYTALDEEFSQTIFDAFTRQTGIEVLAKYDTEATKTVGLANAILAERERPRADVFWNNELLHTLRLKREGLLRQQPLQAAANYPAEYRSPDNDWYGFAARARVLIVNTDRVPEARWPDSIEAFTDPQWGDRCGIAKPLFGTTATHAACLFHKWGDERAKKFFEGVKRNARIVSGNKRVAQDVAEGRLWWGLTDTDDAMIEKEAGRPVEIIYPDQSAPADGGALGTLFLPNAIAMVEGSPNPRAGQALAEFLLTSAVECRLVIGPSAQIPLSRQSQDDNACRCRVKTPEQVTPMRVDWPEVVAGWDDASQWLAETFSVAL